MVGGKGGLNSLLEGFWLFSDGKPGGRLVRMRESFEKGAVWFDGVNFYSYG